MEKKRMTKAEAVELLKNRKVYVNGKSAEIQKKLFELGLKWQGQGLARVTNEAAPFIFIDKNMRLGYSCSMDLFKVNQMCEISAEEILSIEVVEEEPKCSFKPFERVLVRDSDDEKWRPNLFGFFDEEEAPFSFCCIGENWEQCIPYEGNEHLLGTTNNPEE